MAYSEVMATVRQSRPYLISKGVIGLLCNLSDCNASQAPIVDDHTNETECLIERGP